MRSAKHEQHLKSNVSHMDCSECRADNERRWTGHSPFRYAHVHEYLTYVRPRLAAIREKTEAGESVEARIWLRGFIGALNNRINSHLPERGRKYSHSYLERFKQWRRCGKPGTETVDAGYLRQFARRGASCLDRRT